MIPNYFTEEEAAIIRRNSEFRNKGKTCPVCDNTGHYRFEGKTYECPDDDYGHPQWRLCKLYWLHNLGMEYQPLIWERYPHQVIKAKVDAYISNFKENSFQGLGLSFHSKNTGTGKTWAATQILREVVKQGYDAWFAEFFEVPGYYDIDDREERAFKIKRVQEAELLVLDEIKKPYSEAQRAFFADKLEDLLRPRSNAGFPTIITTNMSPEELDEVYPRVSSLVAAKNYWIEMPGSDARMTTEIWKFKSELAANGERCPIS